MKINYAILSPPRSDLSRCGFLRSDIAFFADPNPCTRTMSDEKEKRLREREKERVCEA